MARAPTAPLPIQAPIAPQRYDKSEEDRWRQMVEQTIRDLAASTQVIAGGEIIEGGGGGFFPSSAITGMASAQGTDAGPEPAVVQLLNPSDSGVNVLIYELYTSLPKYGGGTLAVTALRMETPTDLTGEPTYIVSLVERLDEEDVRPIKAILSAAETGRAIIAEADAEFFAPGAATEGSSGWSWTVLRAPDTEPIVLPPGWSIEFTALRANDDAAIRVWPVWDEVAV
jgi:hypothetical protein